MYSMQKRVYDCLFRSAYQLNYLEQSLIFQTVSFDYWLYRCFLLSVGYFIIIIGQVLT